MTERTFATICLNHGFARLAPRFYSRCIGDGVYQTIFTGFKKYIDTDSPNYSAQNRKSYYISIGLRSIYSRYDESIFIPGKDCGGYRPTDFRKKARNSDPFNGIEDEYAIMAEGGFDILDSIDTQESLLNWWDQIQISDTGQRIHDLHLVESLLLCGRYYEAETEISMSFIHGMDAFMSYCDHVERGDIQRELSYEQRIWDSANKEMILWRWCIGRNHTKLRQYINANYNRNMEWICKYGIPVDRHTHERFFDFEYLG